MTDETYNTDDVVELVGGKIVRLKSDIARNGHYLATLDVDGTSPPEVIGNIIYVHQTDIFRRVNARQDTG